MKAARAIAIAVLSYTAMLAPTASQASSIEVPVPGGHVRLPAPPMLPVPPVVVIQGDRGHDSYEREPEHRHYERRYYHEDHRRHHDDYRGHYDHDRYRGDHRH